MHALSPLPWAHASSASEPSNLSHCRGAASRLFLCSIPGNHSRISTGHKDEGHLSFFFFFFHLSFLMEGPAPSDVDTIQGDFHFTTILQFGLLAFLGPHLVSSALTPGFSLELGCLEAKST